MTTIPPDPNPNAEPKAMTLTPTPPSRLPPVLQTLIDRSTVEAADRARIAAEKDAEQKRRVYERGNIRRRAALKAAMTRFSVEQGDDPEAIPPNQLFDLFDMDMTDPYEAGKPETGSASIYLTLRRPDLAPVRCCIYATESEAVFNTQYGWLVMPAAVADVGAIHVDGTFYREQEVAAGMVDPAARRIHELHECNLTDEEIRAGGFRQHRLMDALALAHVTQQRLNKYVADLRAKGHVVH